MGVSLRECARQLGLTHPALIKAKRLGRIPVEEDGSLDPESVREALGSSKSPTEGGVRRGVKVEQKDPDPVTFYEARTKAERHRAELLEMESAERRGELISRSDVSQAWATIAVGLRDTALSVPDRVAAQIASESDPIKVHALLTAEMKHLLRLISTPPTEQ